MDRIVLIIIRPRSLGLLPPPAAVSTATNPSERVSSGDPAAVPGPRAQRGVTAAYGDSVFKGRGASVPFPVGASPRSHEWSTRLVLLRSCLRAAKFAFQVPPDEPFVA